VRSKSKGEYLERLFEDHPKGRFSFVIVEDIDKEGAFDLAVIGVDAVEHTASPVSLEIVGDPQALIGPAVRGTTGILESIKRYAPTVKRVVITSSVASLVDFSKEPPLGEKFPTLDETDWNTLSPKEVEERGWNAEGVHKYRASKVLAERAAWEFVEKNNADVGFDVVTICPPLVFGPILHEVPSETALNSSMVSFRQFTSLPAKPTEEYVEPVNKTGFWVDVRDVAAIHALALANPVAGGERFLVCSGPNTWQDILDAIHAALPDNTDVAVGAPGKGKPHNGLTLSSAKAQKTFGYKFATVGDMAPETLQALRRRGF